MGPSHTPASTIIGIIAIVLGILVLLGGIGLGDIANFLGILLIIGGVLILVGVLTGSTAAGVIFLVLGILLVVGFLPIPGPLAIVLRIAVGIALLIYGILLVARK